MFSTFKDYLQTKLEDKGTKQIGQKSKIDKKVVQLKYKGNQKQFQLNAGLDSILQSTEIERERSEPNLELKKLSQEASQLLRKRQKLIKVRRTARTVGRWQQSMDQINWRPARKVKNVSRRPEKQRIVKG